jgi:lysophospholipase L1-like esterase
MMLRMMRKSSFLLVPFFAGMLLGADHWVATWGASPAPQLSDAAQMQQGKLVFENQTIREIVHVSIGGDSLRVRLSNAFGGEPVLIGAAHIALREANSSIVSGTDRPLTFGGKPSIVIPANALVLSDPVNLKTPALADLAISIFLPQHVSGAGIHYSAQQTSYIAPGDTTASAKFDDPATVTSWEFLTAVETLAPEKTGMIIAFGDSITDGAHSTNDTNHRWPNTLADRLHAAHKTFAVIDAGIGGNRILHDGEASKNIRFGRNALARFDRDVIAQAGVKYLIILEGINDIGHAGTSAPASEAVTADDMIAGLKQLIDRAHEKGIKVIGGTLTPFEGAHYFTDEGEKKREAVNEWIRTGKAFDGYIDFDKAAGDPANPLKLKADYDSGDHLHPNDAGYKAMGEAIDLSLFK